MRRLILLRHGQAEPATGGDDRARSLTVRGREDARQAGRRLAAAGERIDLALVSPALRAGQTWEAVAEAFPNARLERPARFYAADPGEMLSAAEGAEAETVAVVAHNPGLHALALQLLQGGGAPVAMSTALRRGFPPAAAAVFARGETAPDDLGRWVGEAVHLPTAVEQAET